MASPNNHNHPPQLPRLSLPPTTASSFKRSFEELGFEIDEASPGGSGSAEMDSHIHGDTAQGQQNEFEPRMNTEAGGSEHGHGDGERVPKRARSASYEGARGWTEASGSGSSSQPIAGPSSNRSPDSSSTLSSSSPPHASHSASHTSHSASQSTTATRDITRASSSSLGSMGMNLSLQLSLIGPSRSSLIGHRDRSSSQPPRLPRLALEQHQHQEDGDGDDVRMNEEEESNLGDEDRDELDLDIDDPPTLPPILPISDVSSTDTASTRFPARSYSDTQGLERTVLRRGLQLSSGGRRHVWASPSGSRSRSPSPRRSLSSAGPSLAPVLPPIRLAGEGNSLPLDGDDDEGEQMEISIGRIARGGDAAIGPSFSSNATASASTSAATTPPFRNLLDSALDVLREPSAVPGDMAGLSMSVGLGLASRSMPAPTRTRSPPFSRTMSPPRRMGVGAPAFAHRTTPEPRNMDVDANPIDVDVESIELAIDRDYNTEAGRDSLEMATAQMREAREVIERSEETIASVRALRDEERSGAGAGDLTQHPVTSSSSSALPPHSSLFTSSPPPSHAHSLAHAHSHFTQPLSTAYPLSTAQASTLRNCPFGFNILDDARRYGDSLFHDVGGGSSTADIARAEAEFTGVFRDRVTSIMREHVGNPEVEVVFDANPGEASGLGGMPAVSQQARQPQQTSDDTYDRRQAVIDRLSNRLHTLQETRRRREEERREQDMQREEETRQRREEQERLLRVEENRLRRITADRGGTNAAAEIARDNIEAIEMEMELSREREGMRERYRARARREREREREMDGAMNLSLNLGLEFNAASPIWEPQVPSAAAGATPGTSATVNPSTSQDDSSPRLDFIGHVGGFSDYMQRMMNSAYSASSTQRSSSSNPASTASSSANTTTTSTGVHRSNTISTDTYPSHLRHSHRASEPGGPNAEVRDMRRRMLQSPSSSEFGSEWRRRLQEEEDAEEERIAAELVRPRLDVDIADTRLDIADTSARISAAESRLQAAEARVAAFNRAAEDIEFAAQRLQDHQTFADDHFDVDIIRSQSSGQSRWSYRTYDEMGLRPEERTPVTNSAGSVPAISPRLTTHSHPQTRTQPSTPGESPSLLRVPARSRSGDPSSTQAPEHRHLSSSSYSAYLLPDIRHTLDLDTPAMDDEDVLRSWSGLINTDGSTTTFPHPSSAFAAASASASTSASASAAASASANRASRYREVDQILEEAERRFGPVDHILARGTRDRATRDRDVDRLIAEGQRRFGPVSVSTDVMTTAENVDRLIAEGERRFGSILARNRRDQATRDRDVNRLIEAAEARSRERVRRSSSGNNGLGAVGDHLRPSRLGPYRPWFETGSYDSPIEVDSDDDDSMEEAELGGIPYTSRHYGARARRALGRAVISNRPDPGRSRESPIELDGDVTTPVEEAEFLPRPDLGGTFSTEAASLPGHPYGEHDRPQPPPMTRSVATMGIGSSSTPAAVAPRSTQTANSGGDITMAESSQSSLNESSASSISTAPRGPIAHGGSLTPPWLRARPSGPYISDGLIGVMGASSAEHGLPPSASLPTWDLPTESDDSEDSIGEFSHQFAQELQRQHQSRDEQLSRQRRDFSRAQRERVRSQLERLSRERRQAEREQAERSEMFERERERILSESTRPPELPPLAFDSNTFTFRPVENATTGRNGERAYGDGRVPPPASSTATNPTVAPSSTTSNSTSSAAPTRRATRFGYPPYTAFQGITPHTSAQSAATTSSSATTAASASSSQHRPSAVRDIHELMNERSHVMAARESSGRSLEAANRSRASMEATRASLDTSTHAQEAIDRARAAFDRDRSMSEENMFRMLHERETRRRTAGGTQEATGADPSRRRRARVEDIGDREQSLLERYQQQRADAQARASSGSAAQGGNRPAISGPWVANTGPSARSTSRSASRYGGDRSSLFDSDSGFLSPYTDYVALGYDSARLEAEAEETGGPSFTARWHNLFPDMLGEHGGRETRTRQLGESARFGGRIHSAAHRQYARRRVLGDYMRDEDFDGSYENLLSLASTLGDVRSRGTPTSTLDSMPSATVQEWKTDDSDTRCPICLDDYSPEDTVMKLPDCSHWLHKDCLQQWLKGAQTCPICRRRVRGTTTARLHNHHRFLSSNADAPIHSRRSHGGRFRRVGDLMDNAGPSNTGPSGTGVSVTATAGTGSAATAGIGASTTVPSPAASTGPTPASTAETGPASSRPLSSGAAWVYDSATGLIASAEAPSTTRAGTSHPLGYSSRRPIMPLPARHSRPGSSSMIPSRSDSPAEATAGRHNRAASTSRLVLPRCPSTPPSNANPSPVAPALPRRGRDPASDFMSTRRRLSVIPVDASLDADPFSQASRLSTPDSTSSAPSLNPDPYPRGGWFTTSNPTPSALRISSSNFLPASSSGVSSSSAADTQQASTRGRRHLDADAVPRAVSGPVQASTSSQLHDDNSRGGLFDAYATLNGIDDDHGIRAGRRRVASVRALRSLRREATTRSGEAEREASAADGDEDVAMANAEDDQGSGSGGTSGNRNGSGAGSRSGGSARDDYMDSPWGPYGGGLL